MITVMASPPQRAESRDRDALVQELSELTLPLMWSLRQAATRAFEPLGMRPVKALLLTLIVEAPRHPKELSDLLDTVPPVISTLVADLEERDLIQRVPDQNDRRRVRLCATPAGKASCQRLAAAWHQVSLEGTAPLGDDELRTLIGLYRRVLEAE